MSAELAAFPLANALISAAFSAIVLRRYRRRGSPALLAWGVGLVTFALASLLQVTAELGGWAEASYKAYYLLAHLNVGLLALGSILLFRRPWGRYFLLYLVLLTAAFAYALALARVDLSVVSVGGNPLGDQPVRYFSFPYTVPGSIALIGISLYSWWRTRLSYNLFITAGFVLAALAGISARLSFELPVVLYSLTLLAIVLLFVGFILSRPAPQPQPEARPAAT